MISEKIGRFGRGLKGWRKVLLLSSLLVVGVTGVGAVALSDDDDHGRSGTEKMLKHADKALDSVDATPQQRAKVNVILAQAAGDLAPVRASFESAGGQFADIIAAGRIDRDAAERLRAERIMTADQASRRMLTAALDSAEVLTPEQRAKLKARFDDRDGS